jgi:amino acid permease
MVYFIINLVDEVNYNDIPVARFKNLPLVIGVALFSFEAIGTLLEVRRSMSE